MSQSAPDGCPVSNLDPFDEAVLRDPYVHHAELRDAGSVVWFDKYDLIGMARHGDVREALSNWETYCSGRGVGLTDFAKEEPWRPPSIILEADPPLHTRTRGVLSRALSAAEIDRFSDTFRQKADALVSELLNRDVEGIADIAEAYPLSVFPDAVGLVSSGRENLLPYGSMAFNAFGPRNALFEEAFANAQPVAEWIGAQCQREALAEGCIGRNVFLSADDGEVSEDEAALLVRSLLTAGLDTTVHGTGAMLLAFASHPDQWQVLKEDPRVIRNAFNEVLRFYSPVQTFMRTTTREVNVGEVILPEGQKVVLFLAAANRDPRAWDNPDDFDVRRRNVGHVAFGHGIHVCVGQTLARMEIQALIAALVDRVEQIELVGHPQWRLNNTLRGLSQIPIRLRG